MLLKRSWWCLCNCKMLADNCDRPREVCLFFDGHITDRTKGRLLSKEEAKELLYMADKKGLMHTGGPYNWREVGLTAVCNCCADCCYPFRAAKQLGTKVKWPKSRTSQDMTQKSVAYVGDVFSAVIFGLFFWCRVVLRPEMDSNSQHSSCRLQ